MKSKVFKVFICSTFSDLKDERQEVISAIQLLGLKNVSMELFGARPERSVETCLNEVRSSDIFVGIVGHRYGSIVPNEDLSYSEMEYDEATLLGIPRLIYVKDRSVSVLPEHFETDPNSQRLLKTFKEKLNECHTVMYFKSVEKLALQVVADLSREIEKLRYPPKNMDQLLTIQQNLEVSSSDEAAVESGRYPETGDAITQMPTSVAKPKTSNEIKLEPILADSDPHLNTPYLSSFEIDIIGKQFVNIQLTTALAIPETENYFWQGTSGGLIKRNKSTGDVLKHITTVHGLPDNYITDLAINSDMSIWVGTDYGLAKVENDGIVRIIETPTKALIVDPENTLWIGTIKGIFKIRNDGIHEKLEIDEKINQNINGFAIDQDSFMWVATHNGLIKIKDDKIVKFFTEKDGLAVSKDDKRVLSVAVDHKNHVWIGTRWSGVTKIVDGKVKKYIGRVNGLNDDWGRIIFTYFQEIWVGGENGISVIKDEKVQDVISVRNGLSHNYIWAIKGDSKNIWVGDYNGLHKLKGKDVIQHLTQTHPTGLKTNQINKLAFGSNFNLLMTSQGYLYKIKNEKVISANHIGCVCFGLQVDKKENIWVGGTNGLLRISSKDEHLIFNEGTGLPTEYITAIGEDFQNNIWIGCGPYHNAQTNHEVNESALVMIKDGRIERAEVYRKYFMRPSALTRSREN